MLCYIFCYPSTVLRSGLNFAFFVCLEGLVWCARVEFFELVCACNFVHLVQMLMFVYLRIQIHCFLDLEILNFEIIARPLYLASYLSLDSTTL